MNLEENERLEDLQCGNLKIIQNKNLYTFTSDSVVLANFITTQKDDLCVEIGAGSAVISLLLTEKTSFKKIFAFELQTEMAKLAQKNVDLNCLQEKIVVINDDIKNFNKTLQKGSMDVVFSNPPYMKSCSKNKNQTRDIARHDYFLSVEDLCKSASELLKFGGSFYVVYSAERSVELISNLIKYNLQPKKMFFTSNGKGRVVLVVIEAVKGGKYGVKVLPELITNDSDGKYIETLHTKYIKK